MTGGEGYGTESGPCGLLALVDDVAGAEVLQTCGNSCLDDSN